MKKTREAITAPFNDDVCIVCDGDNVNVHVIIHNVLQTPVLRIMSLLVVMFSTHMLCCLSRLHDPLDQHYSF